MELDPEHVARLREKLAQEEGERLIAYLDTAKPPILTVGIGHNCEAKPVPGVTKPGDTITREVELTLFETDLHEACVRLDQHLPWWRGLDMDRQCIMLDLCFNMGWRSLCTFVHTLAHIKAGIDDPSFFNQASDDMTHSLWHVQVGTRATFLEAAMRSGVY